MDKNMHVTVSVAAHAGAPAFEYVALLDLPGSSEGDMMASDIFERLKAIRLTFGRGKFDRLVGGLWQAAHDWAEAEDREFGAD